MRVGAEVVSAITAVREILRSTLAGDTLALDVVRGGQALAFSTEVIAFPLEQHEGARIELGQVDAGGCLLRVVALLPDRPGPHPVVYFLPGAHWASEEYPLSTDHPVPALLGALARAGYASVRVERSGVGDSQGPPCGRVDFLTELAGYQAGFEFIRDAEWADRDRIFLLGHSLGAMVAPLLASENRVAGVACYAPSAVPISDALVGALLRHARLSSEEGPSARDRAPLIAELIRLVVMGGRTPQEVFAERPDLAAVAPAHFTGDSAYHRIARFYHQLERVDLDSAWQRLGAPALFVHGERDYICTAEDALCLAELAPDRSRFVSLPGVDHHMSDAPPTAPPRLAPPVFAAFHDWLEALR
jgi:pimeloyl-ACP methyl ester carboxylesterase